MPGTANTPNEKVRELQRKLYVCAKQSRTRRFHALYDRIYQSDVLWEAWRRVRSNRGAAGVDAETIQAIEQRGEGEFLAEIVRISDLRRGHLRAEFVPKLRVESFHWSDSEGCTIVTIEQHSPDRFSTGPLYM